MYDRDGAQDLTIFSAYSVRNLFDLDTPKKIIYAFNEVMTSAFRDMPELVKYIKCIGTRYNMVNACVAKLNALGYDGYRIVERTNMPYMSYMCYFPLLEGNNAYEELDEFAGIYVNEECLIDIDVYEAKIIKRQTGGMWSQGASDLKYPISHEVGHAVDRWLHISQSKELLDLYNKYPFSLSIYGSFSAKEFFAEAFAEYTTSENPRKEALLIKQMVLAAIERKRNASGNNLSK